MTMDVRLLYHTPDPQRAIAASARLCYSPVGAAELLEHMTDEAVHRVLKTVISSGHTSTLEHASYTFAIDGVSRAMTHQLVRHRLASYNQQSQRYVAYDSEPVFVVPPSIAADQVTRAAFDDACAAAFEAYRAQLDAGVPAEDARYLLPNAMETKIVVTMNVRELLHFFELRCCRRAVGDPRGRFGDARPGRAHGALHLHGRRRVVPPRPVWRRQDDVRRPLPEGAQT